MTQNIFFSNIDDEDISLQTDIKQGINHYEYIIRKVIKNVKGNKYQMRWKKYNLYSYNIKPIFSIRLKQNSSLQTELLIQGSYNPQSPFLNVSQNYIPINLEVLNISHVDGNDRLKVKFRDVLSYDDEIQHMGKKVLLINDDSQITLSAEDYVNHLKKLKNISNIQLRQGNQILATYHSKFDDIKAEIDEIDTLTGFNSEITDINLLYADIYDKNGNYSTSNRQRFKTNYRIDAETLIEGDLLHKTNNYPLTIKQFVTKKENWIKLIEPDIIDHDLIEEGSSLVEVFMELIKMDNPKKIYNFQSGKKYKGKAIRVFSINSYQGLLLVNQFPTSDIIIPPDASSQLRKQRNALNVLRYYPSPRHINLLRLFKNVENTSWDEVIFKNENINWQFLVSENGQLRQGTDDQREFVEKAIATPDFVLLEGPPGSGKTTAITELIYQLINKDKKILMVASTHVAVDNVLEKLVDFYGSSEKVFAAAISPLRIGDEDKISEELKDFQIDNLKKSLFNKLKASDHPISSNYSEEVIEQKLDTLLIQSSNLVVGTTIGILRFPLFNRERFNPYIEPEFDYLIIDEASKTTLQQFFVSAIHTKKWVLAGDIKQLPPYIDDLFIRISLEGLLDQDSQFALLLSFLLMNNRKTENWIQGKYRTFSNFPGIIIPVRREVVSKIISINNDKMIDDKTNRVARQNIANFNKIKKVFIISHSGKKLKKLKGIDIIPLNEIDPSNKYSLFEVPIIFVEAHILDQCKDRLPVSHTIINLQHESDNGKTNSNIENQKLELGYKRKFLENKLHIKSDKFSRSLNELQADIQRSWAGQISWRIRRKYELENTNNTKSISYYNTTIHSLLPTQNHGRIHKQISQIEQIFFPSILTALQKGILRKRRNEDYANILHKGFRKEDKMPRYVSLRYQHRMHDDIADIPRRLYYKDNNNQESLQTSKAILNGLRAWQKPPPRTIYDMNRLYWIHTEDEDKRNKNDSEAKLIINEVVKFIDWARDNDIKGLRILVLSYYNKQREFIGDELRKKYSFIPPYTRSHFEIYNTSVRIYTVDKVQGREGDIVFLSMVRNKKIGFMDSPNRLNVAITRAKYLLNIYGNYDFFRSDKHGFDDIKDLCRTLQSNNRLLDRNYNPRAANKTTKHNRRTL